MRITKNALFLLSYKLLIAVTIFSPERYGTTLKYGFAPLLLMVFFCRICKKITASRLTAILFILFVFISTMRSNIAEISVSSANFRSLIIMIAFFALLSDSYITSEQMEDIKGWYEYCTIFCGIIVIINVIRFGANRYRFYFLFNYKDVNYLTAFMLPGCHIAIRRLFFEKREKRKVHILCIVFFVVSILLLQTRASFISLIMILAIQIIEYLNKGQFTIKKLVFMISTALIAIIGSYFLLTYASTSRLTNFSHYEENIRLVIWNEGLNAYKNEKLFGSGLGAASYYSNIVTGYDTHNNFLDILGDFGILGSISFLLLLFVSVKAPRNRRLYMISYATSFFLPLAFINGFQTITFWMPMIMLMYESKSLNNLSKSNNAILNTIE